MKKILVSGLVLTLLLAPGIAFSGNLADVTQAGNQDYANVGQNGADNTANVGQYGNGLEADVNQIGTSNEATVAQGADGAPVNSDPLVGYVSGAVIFQEGDNNTASTTWHVGNLGSRISQIGNGNSGTQDLAATSGYKAGKYAIDIQQVGNDNSGTQITTAKYGTYGIQDMLILQTGDSNTGHQTSISGISHGAEIIQTGNSNFSTQYQDGMKDVVSANIVGNSNVTSQIQLYTVWGLTERTATIDIVGDVNTANQTQQGVSTVADIDIVGTGNMAIQNQFGDNNVANMSQVGDNNFASQMQTGNGNSSTVSQAGNSNIAFVVQHN